MLGEVNFKMKKRQGYFSHALCIMIHYTFAILLAFGTSMLGYYKTSVIGSKFDGLFLFFPIYSDVRALNPLFYLLGLIGAIVGYLLLWKLYLRFSGDDSHLFENKIYKVMNILLLIFACILTLFANLLAYLHQMNIFDSIRGGFIFVTLFALIIPALIIVCYRKRRMAK